MIIARSPLRITLAGGGTDFPPYVAVSGGSSIVAAIDHYVYIAANEMFYDGYRLRYSETEHAAEIDQLEHPIFREALRAFQVDPGIEIASFADIPAGTGLGSSASFTVALTKALAAYRGDYLSRETAAEIATTIELRRCGRPGGVQDHWASAMGGLTRLWFRPDGRVRAEPLDFGVAEVERHISLYFTGFTRDAELVLTSQTTVGLDEIKALGYRLDKLLERGEMEEFGRLTLKHWEQKRRRSPRISDNLIDRAVASAVSAGAFGAKLIGAGGGGFLMVVHDWPAELRERWEASVPELKYTPFSIDREGVRLL